MKKGINIVHAILQKLSLLLILVALVIAMVSLFACSKNDDAAEADNTDATPYYKLYMP